MKSFRGFSEAFSFQFIDELAELVEVYAGSETERVGHRLWRLAAASLCRFAKPGTDRPVHRFLERYPELSRAFLEEPGQIVVDGQCGAHLGILSDLTFDVKTS